MSTTSHRRWSLAGLGGATGLAVGLTLGGLGVANAAGGSSTTTTPAGGAAATPATPPTPGSSPSAPNALDQSGTVSVVGTSSVTIKTSAGDVVYQVTSTSDIDKNGEAALKDLAVGDAVTFSSTGTGASATIDKLHAGTESLDRPHGGPGGFGGPNGPGDGAPSATSGLTGTVVQ